MGNLDPFRAGGNPLFNDNKLELAIFGSNCSNACAMTLAETSFEPTWETNVEIARILEAGGIECMLPIAAPLHGARRAMLSSRSRVPRKAPVSRM
jgi:hypothetical protein